MRSLQSRAAERKQSAASSGAVDGHVPARVVRSNDPAASRSPLDLASSPRIAAQRQQLQSAFGPTIRRQAATEEAPPMTSAPGVLQRVIAANPQPVDQTGMLAFGGAAMDMGLTHPIAGSVVPTYVINTVPAAGGGGVEANVVKTANAFEGNSNAVYMQPGIYPSGLMLADGGLGPFAAGGRNRQVYAELSATNSNLSHLAEQEHLDDLRRAFQITLDVADLALDQAVNANPHGPQATAVAAQQTAEAFINARIAAIAGPLGTAPFTITAGLAALYQAKEQLTNTGRDGPGLHTFDIDRVNASTSMAAWAMYLLSRVPGVEKKDIRPVIPSPTFQVPGPPSNALIV